jgi:hypothetical protein
MKPPRLLLVPVVFACFSLPALLPAQEGASADVITFPKPGGTITLRNCVITKIEPDGVRVTHSAGTAKVPYEHLPEAWKTAIPYDATAAQAYRLTQESVSQDATARAEKEKKALYEIEMAKLEKSRPKLRPVGTTWISREAMKADTEIFHVRVLAVEDDALIAERMSERPPTIDPQSAAAGAAIPVVMSQAGLWPTGTFVLLSGNLPKDVADQDEFSVQADRDGTRRYDAADGSKRTLRVYEITRHNAPQ